MVTIYQFSVDTSIKKDYQVDINVSLVAGKIGRGEVDLENIRWLSVDNLEALIVELARQAGGVHTSYSLALRKMLEEREEDKWRD